MKTRSFAALLLCAVLVPRPLFAWGLDVHRLITGRAIDLLPASIRPFFEKHRNFITEHSVDPDLWRNAGFTEEPSRHYLDLDAYGAYPFAGLPRDRRAAIQKFGRDKIDREGQLPWRVDEIYGRLLQAFQQQKAGTNPYSLDDVKFFSAAISHYVSDAHVPLHAAKNYDGQLTNQHGIHSRFETEAVLRYQARLALRPSPLFAVPSPVDFVFDALLKSFTFVDPVLKADREAARGRAEYDDGYFGHFFGQVRPILERRLNDSMTAVASMIASAWEKGGKPELPLEVKRLPRKIKRERP
ncbi:MAG: hypothetical protein L0387_12450 [Acidobacteria bacterium]|nr:hypothetical protein [Acidobacteriota bacterium]MCI0722369.1 hypothetical protein [Acidobacteriota bacterium]